MAKTTCSIEGCVNSTRCRGWCNTHYHRWYRRGNPEIQFVGGRAMRELVASSAVATDDCVLWTRGTTLKGYGLISRPNYGGTVTVNALVCEWTHGPKPSPELQAAHTCGVKLCVNPRHIRWDTQAENEADKKVHGTYFMRGRKSHA